MTYKISQIPTHDATPIRSHKLELENAGGTSVYSTLGEALLSQPSPGPYKNLLVNPGCTNDDRVNAGSNLAASAAAVIGVDPWFGICQTGNVSIQPITNGYQAAGYGSGVNIVQPDVTAQRIGALQIMGRTNIIDLAVAGSKLTISGSCRTSKSGGTNMRWALIEWVNGAEMTRYPVLTWGSATYAKNGFFINSSFYNILAVGQEVIAAQNTNQAMTTTTVQLGSTAQELMFVFWSESTLAQGVGISCRAQIERGDTQTSIEALDRNTEQLRARRFYQNSFAGNSPIQNVGLTGAPVVAMSAGTTNAQGSVPLVGVSLNPEMAVTPAITTFNPLATNSSWRDLTGAADLTAATANILKGSFILKGNGAPAAAGRQYAIHWAADANLGV